MKEVIFGSVMFVMIEFPVIVLFKRIKPPVKAAIPKMIVSFLDVFFILD